MGYFRAGFDVVGVDIKPQPRYPFEFHQADALEYAAAHGHEFDAIHASPPCQAYCALKHMATKDHPDLVAVTRDVLVATGKPYVIENVPGAPLDRYVVLCGTMFNLGTDCGAQLRRHRLFESNILIMSPGPCQHTKKPVIGVYGGPERDRRRSISVTGTGNAVGGRVITVAGHGARQPGFWNEGKRESFPHEQARKAMGIEWMNRDALSQAIPPAYTEWIGRQLMEALS